MRRFLLQQRQLGLVFLLRLRFEQGELLVLRDLELVGLRIENSFCSASPCSSLISPLISLHLRAVCGLLPRSPKL